MPAVEPPRERRLPAVSAAAEDATARDVDIPSRPWLSSVVGSVAFYLPDQRALNGRDPDTLDCDRDWHVFGTGVYVWVLQTYVRLRAAGAPVRLTRTPALAGVVVTHADYVERLLAEAPSAPDLTILSARADRPPQLYADIEVVQNRSSVEDFQIFVPSWNQPGLIPRRHDRGTRVETIAYVGARKQVHDDLAHRDWADALRSRGLCWEMRMVDFGGNDRLYADHRWNDYSTIDVVVAVRPPAMWSRKKPAAKLTNAWAAGTPAILSPEPAYAELRSSHLDYLEARNGAEALDAIDRLRRDRGLYAAMVARGLERAREFETGAVAARWAEVLWQTVPSRTGAAGYRLAARFRGYRGAVRRARRALTRALTNID
jgi:glycosyl transferase family 1